MADKLPTSGYHLHRVVALEQSYKVVTPEDPGDEDSPRSVSLAWDWQVTGDDAFEVFMWGDLGPSGTDWDEITVSILGEFTFKPSRSLSLERFVGVNAPAMLLPYLRETISALTARGPFGAYYLPSINVVEMGQRYDFVRTKGAAQLREDPDLAKRMGVDPISLEAEPAES